MKTFLNTLSEGIDLEQINSPKGRSYAGKGFRYPSVTTVTGLHSAAGIARWRRQVGAKEANRISKFSSERGTRVHALCEEYLKREELPTMENDEEFIITSGNKMFDAMRPHLDRIDNIHCLEVKMVSHTLKTAGTVDVIAEYDGVLETIDFKTSNKPKEKQWVDGYFMQVAAYSCMYYEATGTAIDRIRLIIGVEGGTCQIFDEPMVPWLKRFQTLREEFRQVKGF